MELKVEIGFDQLLEAIRHLPDDKKLLLKEELSTAQKQESLKSITNFQELLLNGPTIDDEQYKEYKKIRKYMNKWRTK